MGCFKGEFKNISIRDQEKCQIKKATPIYYEKNS